MKDMKIDGDSAFGDQDYGQSRQGSQVSEGNSDAIPAVQSAEVAGQGLVVTDVERAEALENTKRLMRESLSGNTRRVYESALRKLDMWLEGRPESDAALAQYVGWLEGKGLSVSSAQVQMSGPRE